MNIILVFLIAISLSMDAFSLSLAYGTLSFSKKETNILSLIVGIYHFFMPILGMLIGSYIIKIIHISTDLIVLIIFTFIGINMILESRKEQEIVSKMKIGEMILFGLAVSIDSFSVGIGINEISNNKHLLYLYELKIKSKDTKNIKTKLDFLCINYSYTLK